MHKEIIEIDGKIIIEDEKGNKAEVKDTKSLEDTLVIENNIEYLEGEKASLESKIKDLNNENNEIKNSLKNGRIAQILCTVAVFVGSVILVEQVETFGGLARAIASLASGAVTYGLAEAYIGVEKLIIKKNDKEINRHNVSMSFLDKDIEKEKAKFKGKVNYKNPTFVVKKVDDEEVNRYKGLYDALINMDYSDNQYIEVVEADEEPKVKKFGRKI